MSTPTSVVLRLGKLDDTSAEPRDHHYPLELSWADGGGAASVKDKLPRGLKVGAHTGDYSTYRETFLEKSDELAEFSDMGRHLYDLLYRGEVGKKLKEMKAAAGAGGLRVLLKIEDEGLALLPWELMFDGAAERPFQETRNTYVRVRDYDPSGTAPDAEPINWPVRVLIVVGVSADEAKKIRADEEVERIEDVLHKVSWLVDIEVCEEATIDKLRDKCREFRPHVFHYIGHGGVDGDTPYLTLQSPAGGDTMWTATQIANLSAWKWRPRLAFINACRSGAAALSVDEEQQTSWAVADAFRLLKVPAVLTMQADVRGELAGEFAGQFYEGLVEGAPIDSAAAAARILMRDRNSAAQNKDNTRDWATPSLSVSIPPEEVLPLRSQIVCRHEDEEIGCELFNKVSVFAGRRPDRRLFIHGLYPIPPRKPDKEFILIHGGSKMGKTWVTLWCLESYARKGHDVRYVEVMDKDWSPKWLDMLLCIQAGAPPGLFLGSPPLIFRPLDPKAFSEFNHYLPHRLRDESKPPEWDGRDVPLPEGLDTSNLDGLSEATVKEIFKSFRKALVAAAEPGNPLIIVFDRFIDSGQGVTEPHMNKFLLPYLFGPAASGELVAADATGIRSVKLVLVLNDDELKTYMRNNPRPSLDDLRNRSHQVYLDGIPTKDYDRVAREFFRNLKASPDHAKRLFKRVTAEDEELLISFYNPNPAASWKPETLKAIYDVLEKRSSLMT